MIPPQEAHLEVAAHSHPGMSGKNNEDRYGVFASQLHKNKTTPTLLAVVADGIGGHQAGEVAAEITVNIINETVSQSDGAHPVEILKQAFVLASQAIREEAESQERHQGMGSTCVCVWVVGDKLYTTSVGDSRIYLVQGKMLRQLTTDHTWVQEALEFGVITPEQAREHPNAHVIRRYLGSQKPVLPDTRLRLKSDESDPQAENNQGYRLRAGDHLVLCSDGLTDLVEDGEILEAINSKPLEKAVNHLVDLANQRGGHDNITVVALAVPEKPVWSLFGSRWRLLLLAGAGLLFLLLVALLTFLFLGWYFTRPAATPSTMPYTLAYSPVFFLLRR